jgi:hypothetical protein
MVVSIHFKEVLLHANFTYQGIENWVQELLNTGFEGFLANSLSQERQLFANCLKEHNMVGVVSVLTGFSY